jgi:hypothetical protein
MFQPSRSGGPMKHRLPSLIAIFSLLSVAASAQNLSTFEKHLTMKKLANGLAVIIYERPEAPVFS